MINSIEYKILKSISTGDKINEIEYRGEIHFLVKERMIYFNVTEERRSTVLYNGFIILPLGLRAIEEYENFLQSQKREEETLKIAEEANAIAYKANELSKEANKTSDKATKLSGWAFAVSLFGFLLSVATFILSFFK